MYSQPPSGNSTMEASVFHAAGQFPEKAVKPLDFLGNVHVHTVFISYIRNPKSKIKIPNPKSNFQIWGGHKSNGD